jgi:hypothetical protein
MFVPCCKKCLEQNAHPFFLVRANIVCALSPETAERWEDPAVIAQEYIDSMNTYYEGQYMPLRRALSLKPPTRDELEENDAAYEEYRREHMGEGVPELGD